MTATLEGLIPARGRDVGLYLLQLAGFSAAYAALATFSLTWSVLPNAGTPIWPASGLALAALLLGGLRLWPAILIGRLAASILIASPQPLWADLLLGVASVLGAVIPAWHARKVRPLDPSLAALPDMLWLIGAALVSAFVSGAVGMVSLWLAGTSAERLPLAFLNWVLGNASGVLMLTPLILVWSQRESWRVSAPEAAHLVACLMAVTAMSFFIFIRPPIPQVYTWYLFPFMIWAALSFSTRGVSLALVIAGAFAFWSAVHGGGPFMRGASTGAGRLLLGQQFVTVMGLTMLVLASVADERRGKRKIAASEQRLREESQALEILNAVGAAIAADLNLDSVVQKVTDAGVSLAGAQFGVFFYSATGPDGQPEQRYVISGTSLSAIEGYDQSRLAEVVKSTADGAVVRSADITLDPRYVRSPGSEVADHHLVRSYLAVPVKSRTGGVIGALFFCHADVGVFTDRTERIMAGLAAQAGIALDNAQLYQAAQAELAERRRAEGRQRLMINELNHRVKNTLATVQSIAAQTLRPALTLDEAKETLTSRIIALSRAHDVITARTWQGADLKEIVERAVEPFSPGPDSRIRLEGPPVWLQPRSALAIAMALHELGTNAVKYGALSAATGSVGIEWSTNAVGERTELSVVWTEQGGPKVTAPTTRGFGSRLIERGLKADLGGSAVMDFAESGLICRMIALLPDEAAVEAEPHPFAEAKSA